jgi:hypothetical protein
LLAACVLVWITSGIPPAFASSAIRWLALAWLSGGIACLVGVRSTRKALAALNRDERRSRWPLRKPAWLMASSALIWLVLTVGITFVVDSAVPALVLGSDPGRAVAGSVVLTEAQSRRAVDRTTVRFDTGRGVVEAWAADPRYTQQKGSPIVFDRAQPQRVMAEGTWSAARSTWWRLPVATLLWLSSFVAPFVFMEIRARRYGSLRPGHAIQRVRRPRRAKRLTVTWADGPTATFVDIPASLTPSAEGSRRTDCAT